MRRLGLLPSAAEACSACGVTFEWNGTVHGCYSVETGITGNTSCSVNYYGGCTYWGQACTNGQVGPPTPGAYCKFIDPEPCIQRGPYNQYACAPSLENEVLRWTPTPGQRFSVIRTSDGKFVQFAQVL